MTFFERFRRGLFGITEPGRGESVPLSLAQELACYVLFVVALLMLSAGLEEV